MRRDISLLLASVLLGACVESSPRAETRDIITLLFPPTEPVSAARSTADEISYEDAQAIARATITRGNMADRPEPETFVSDTISSNHVDIRASGLPVGTQATLTIYDITGRRLSQHSVVVALPRIRDAIPTKTLQSLPTGVYIIELRAGTQIQTARVAILH